MTWWNTTREKNKKELDKHTNNQAIVIYDVFKKNPNADFTPFEVHEKVLKASPITSIRRAITDLTELGLLVKTDKKRMGIYGKNNYTWKWKLHKAFTEV